MQQEAKMIWTIFFSLICLSAAQMAKETAIPLGGDVSFVCESETIAMWAHKKSEGEDPKFLAAGTSILPNVDSSRYSFSVKGTKYQMTIKSSKKEDAGIFICNNVFRFTLVVVESPVCAPSINSVVEDHSYDFSCNANVYGGGGGGGGGESGAAEWLLGEAIVNGNEKSEENAIRSTYSYTAKHMDREKELRCVIRQPNWDPSFPAPSCSFEKLDVQFAPKLVCPLKPLFKAEEKEFLIKCQIFANPLPQISAIEWTFGQKNKNDNKNGGEIKNRLKITSFKSNADSIEATLKLTNHHLSVRNSNVDVTLNVPNPLSGGGSGGEGGSGGGSVGSGGSASGGSVISKSITAGLIHGPVVSCPEKIEVKKRDKGVAKVSCRIFVNPIPPNSNISWYVDDDFIQRQRQDMIEKVISMFGRTDCRHLKKFL